MTKQDSSIIVADDHPLLLKGIKEFLQEHNYNVVGAATDGEEALSLIQTYEPDIALLDIEMPHLTGIEVARRAASQNISTKIILLSYHDNPEYMLDAKKANIKGFILKEDALQEIKEGIRIVMNGDQYFSQKLQNIDTASVNIEVELINSLTRSQLRIVKMIADGKNTKQIAEELNLSVRTIEKHRSNISAKIGLDGQAYQLGHWVMKVKHLLP